MQSSNRPSDATLSIVQSKLNTTLKRMQDKKEVDLRMFQCFARRSPELMSARMFRLASLPPEDQQDVVRIFTTTQIECLGAEVTLSGLTDRRLNGKPFHIVKVLRERKLYCVDVTPAGWAPERVRYVLVRPEKVEFIQHLNTKESRTTICAVLGSNRSKAFAGTGLDSHCLEYLSVRAHPDIEVGRLWRDLPTLQEKLNREGGPGAPFAVVCGYQIFASWASQAVAGERGEALYVSEPYAVLRDCHGCHIDVAPDIGSLVTHPGNVGARDMSASKKLFIPDPWLSLRTEDAIYRSVDCYMKQGWMPSGPPLAQQSNEGAAGMIRADLNQAWPTDGLDHINHRLFLEMGFPTWDKVQMRHYDRQVKEWRNVVLLGGVLLSRQLAKQLSERYDPVSGAIMAHRDMIGTICFGCYTRITTEQAKVCVGCGVAHYCSVACQHWHMKEHMRACASPEERARRRVVKEREKQRIAALHKAAEEKAALEAAEAAAAEAARKEQIARSRVEADEKKARDLAERIRRAQSQGHKAPNGKLKAGGSTEARLVHQAWDSPEERATRTAAFEAKQELEHLEAETKKAKAKVVALKKLAADASAAAEAATHCVPCAPTLGDAMGSWSGELA